MSTLIVPEPDPVPWPSLGPLVCDFIEEHLVFGPGDLLGEPARLDREKRAIIRRAYELHPRGTAFEGRRRFSDVGISLRKGTAKTELASWIAICEAHPDAPIRFADWNEDGTPEGWGITDPYIPLLATTEGQSETLTYDAVRSILQRSGVRDDFEIGKGFIVRTDGRGKIEAVSTSPDARDGARTTWQCFDETHRLTDDREKKTVTTMKNNIPKRPTAEAWSLSTTTAYTPGEGSVAQDMMEKAEAIAEGKIKEPSLFFFHRQADDGHDMAVHDADDPAEAERAEAEVRAAIEEASGPDVLLWTPSPIEGILTLWRNTDDRQYFERVWLNRPTMSNVQVFDLETVRAGIAPRGLPRRRTEIVIGFDGSRTVDATVLVGTEIESGYQFIIGKWEKPQNAGRDWEVSGKEVDERVHEAMQQYRVKRFICDRPFWETYVDRWAGKWPKICVAWQTNVAFKKTAMAVKDYAQAWKAGEVTYDGDPMFTSHLGNARKRELTMKDDEGVPLYLMEKERGTEKRIDAAYAGMLSWEARAEAIQDGALKRSGGGTTVATY